MTNTDRERRPDALGRGLVWLVIVTAVAAWMGLAVVATVLDFARRALVLVAVAVLVFVVAKLWLSSKQ
jgi:threonine/homoserine/homoserine lactone efflux protein